MKSKAPSAPLDRTPAPNDIDGDIQMTVACTTCHRRKKPIGRDSRDNGLCDHECPGWREDPHPGYLWPGEEACPIPQNCGQSACDCDKTHEENNL